LFFFFATSTFSSDAASLQPKDQPTSRDEQTSNESQKQQEGNEIETRHNDMYNVMKGTHPSFVSLFLERTLCKCVCVCPLDLLANAHKDKQDEQIRPDKHPTLLYPSMSITTSARTFNRSCSSSSIGLECVVGIFGRLFRCSSFEK
jgi:hypothetical protein